MTEILKQHGYFRSFDGVRLYYSVEGPKDAPPLLFCYGLVCSKLQWKYQMEHFKQKYRVIYMDYRGHCQSAEPEDASSVTIENLARDLGTLHDELKLPALPIFGHSLGVNIILDFYRLFPQKVSGLVLANGTPKDPFETMFNHNILQVFFPLVRHIYNTTPELLEKFWANQGQNPINQFMVGLAGFNRKYAKQKDINEYLRITGTVPLKIFLNLLEDFMKHDATHWLHEVNVPTLVLAGEKDLITPKKNQEIFSKLIPHAEYVMIPEGSHCPQMEKIQLVNETLERFLDKVKRTDLANAKTLKTIPKKKKRKKLEARV